MPKPLAELDPATCRALRGVVFDIDDTVTREGRLEREAFDAMWSLARAGLCLVAVTGRPLGWADVVAWHWPVDVAVGENGAGWVWRAGPSLRDATFSPPREQAAQAALLRRVRALVAQEMPHVLEAGDQRLRRCDLAFDVGESCVLPEREVERLVALIERVGARAVVSSVHCHAVPGDWDKFRGTVRALAELGVDLLAQLESWVFVGDSGNDAPAFAGFPCSVGVANVRDALEHLATPPRYITRADRGRGFAELAAHILGCRAGEGLPSAAPDARPAPNPPGRGVA